MKAMKFGGAVLASADGFRHMVEILKNEQTPSLAVVSAFASATRDLEFAARLARKNLTTEAFERLDHILEDHKKLIRQVLPDLTARATLDALLSEVHGSLSNLLRGIAITQQLTKRTLDHVLSFGELLALHIAQSVVHYNGIDVAAINARTVVVTNDEYGLAAPLVEKTRIHVDRILRPLLESHHVVMIQGFIGATEDGTVTTMGKESSNLTATLLGSLLNVSEVIIWTDVEGVRSGDPDFCRNTKVRPLLSYTEAALAAQHGVKILYPTMIAPAQESGIAITIRSASNPSGESTSIGTETMHSKSIVAIQPIDDVTSKINVVFTTLNTWLPVVSRVSAAMTGAIRSVSGSENDAVYTIICSSNDAEHLASNIHDLILNEYSNIQSS
jgi:aspartate kinase